MTNTPIDIPDQVNLVDFISHHAHDLRSPFNRVMGFAKIILKGQDGPLNEVQKEDLTTVYNNSMHAFRLVNSLIDIARLLNNEKQFRPADTDLNSFLDQVITQWKRSFPDKEGPLDIHYKTTQPMIYADTTVLQQALLSAMACAIECVELPAVLSLTVEAEPGWTIFSVASRGQPARSPSQLDLDAQGYLSHALVSLHNGAYRQHETGDQGAVLRFAIRSDISTTVTGN